MVYELCFGSPPKLQEWDLGNLRDAEWMVESRRVEPLVKLEEMVLWEFANTASTKDLLPVFAHCPNLKILTITSLSAHYNHDILGEFIGKTCKRLESMTFGSFDMVEQVEGPLLFRIMEALPAQQVQSIFFRGMFEVGSAAYSLVSLAIQQHSATLHTIHLSNTENIVKIPVDIIMKECINLRVLVINGEDHNEDDSIGGLYVTLSDLLKHPWNTIKLIKLSLFVNMFDLPVRHEDMPAMYSTAKSIHLNRWGQLHRRVRLLDGLLDVNLEPADVSLMPGVVIAADEGELSFMSLLGKLL
ncbi:hypothetical protein EC991_008086 [Linnemannia zychae]|nr:hypothetical protein EC991_008086 [Linnemannia zychae]